MCLMLRARPSRRDRIESTRMGASFNEPDPLNFEYLFMRADGEQLSEITRLVERGVIKPLVD